jgi:hypothetical protein
MKRVQVVVLCIIAIGVAGAIASASASASLPEYRFCVKTEPAKTGEYTEKNCLTHAGTPGTGNYELETWEHESKRAFKGTLGVSTHDAYIPESEAEPWKGGTVISVFTCKGGSSEGEITGSKSSLVTLTFTTCTTEGKKCTSAGQKTGVIETNPLKGEIGYLTAGHAVGTRLSAATGAVVAEYTCEGYEVATRASLIGVDSGNVNKPGLEGTLTYEVNGKGGQEVVFGEFPAGEGPFYQESFINPPGVTLPEGMKLTMSQKQKGGVLDIVA